MDATPRRQLWPTFTAAILLLVLFASCKSGTGPAEGNDPPEPPVIGTTGLPSGQVATPYSETLEATGGSGSYTWSLASGALPDGLALSGAGVIAGTPTTAQTRVFTVQVTAGGGPPATQQLSITIVPIPLRTLTVTGAGNGDGTVTSNPVGISCTIAGTSASGDCSKAYEEGLSVALSHSAAVGHAFVSWSGACSGSGSCTLDMSQDRSAVATFDEELQITTSSLPDGQVGAAYSQTLQATGGSGPKTWSAAGGSLPAGLSLSTDGVVSGTPTTFETQTFTAQVASGGQTATRQLSITIATNLGTVRVRTETSGTDIDADGYAAEIDGGASTMPIGANGETDFAGLTEGDHQAGISGVAANCAVQGQNPTTVTVVAGQTATATFTVTCVALGAIEVTTATTGGQPDPDGYSVSVDGAAADLIGNAETKTYPMVAGTYSVALTGLAANCSVALLNPRDVVVTSGATVSTTFDVDCPIPQGTLDVTTVTTGGTPDPDGYALSIDGAGAGAIAVAETRSFTLDEGQHSVELTGLAANCTVAATNPRNVDVPAGGTIVTTFDVDCPTPPGTIDVTTVTTGATPDPDGYGVSIDGSAAGSIGTGETQSFGADAGTRSVELTGVALNCTVAASNPRDVVVPSGGTVATTFDVDCPTPEGTLEVTTNTGGAVPDGDGYSLSIDGSTVGAISTAQTLSFPLTEGLHSVELTGTAANCSVTGTNPRDETITGFQTTTTTFTVDCPCTLNAPGDADGDRLPDCTETNTNVYVSPTDTGTNPNNRDTDQDDLDDGNEVLGTAAGLDLPGMGVSPLRKDILVEYDWFDDALECGSHSHRPTAAAVAKVTVPFVNSPVPNPDGSTGINFIHDYGQGGLFTGGNMISDADGVLTSGVGGAEYVSHKTANFDVNRLGYFHYVMMPHRYNTNSGSSGQAEVNGDDMIVSLYCANSDQNVANTIVHELGHNLSLRHGGAITTNYKPNYNSVMNYRYQFPGIDNDCTPPGNGVLDYSRGTRPALDENNLDETQGVCGNPPGPGWDWNGDTDATDVGLVFDINNADGQFSVLQDYNDWANLFLHGLPGGDGAFLVSSEVVSCMNPAPVGGN